MSERLTTLQEAFGGVAHRGFQLERAFAAVVGRLLDAGRDRRAVARRSRRADARAALEDGVDGAVRRLRHADDGGRGADLAEVGVFAARLRRAVAASLGEDGEHLARGGGGGVDRLDVALVGGEHGHQLLRVDDVRAAGDDGDDVGHVQLRGAQVGALLALVVFGRSGCFGHVSLSGMGRVAVSGRRCAAGGRWWPRLG